MKKISQKDLEWAFSELAEENERLREELKKLKKKSDENTGTSVHTALVGSGPEPGAKSTV